MDFKQLLEDMRNDNKEEELNEAKMDEKQILSFLRQFNKDLNKLIKLSIPEIDKAVDKLKPQQRNALKRDVGNLNKTLG